MLLLNRQDVGTNQSRLVMGMFNIFPAFGYVLPGGHQVINVECVAETPGRCEEASIQNVHNKLTLQNSTSKIAQNNHCSLF